MEQLDDNLLFGWFVGLSLDEAVWDKTVFTKNRERLIEGDIARRFMAAVLNQEPVKALLSDVHSQLPIGQRFHSSLAGTTTYYPLLRSPAARPLIVRWMPVMTSSSASPAR